jgi:SAM-dependent methyltransferase
MHSVTFDRAASYYDATRGFGPGGAERVRDAIVARLGLTRDSRLLELGVGTGRIALPFLEAGYSYSGVDLSRQMLSVLRGKLPAAAPPPLLVEGDVTALPFAAGAFDAAMAVHVLHLVADWRATLHEAARALRRPGGRLLLAGDPGADANPGADSAALAPPVRAQRAWRDALAAAGSSGRVGQPGLRPGDPRVRAELEALGASVVVEDLTEFERPPTTARAVVQGYKDRIYSSDWARPDAEHNAAVAHVERWLAEECPDPDTPYALKGVFRAVIGMWT